METISPRVRKHSALVSSYLPSLLRQQARARPDAVAATDGDRQLTYRDLERTSGGLAARLRELGVGADDCVGLFAEPSVELMTGVWGILLSGGAYLPLSPEYPEERLRYMLADSGATTVVAQRHLTARLRELVPHGTRILAIEEETGQLRECTSLRRVFSGGEALSWQLARQICAELPRASLVNLYGPTECTINATAYLVDPDEMGESGTVPIGVPVDNTQCYVLDANLSPVSLGETGELYVGGAQLARGYRNRPQQTEQRFVPSPFVPTERLYRTGDLVHWNPDGSIQFRGRADNQVKLRGYRVELDEIAVSIEEHAWVRRAAALVTDDPRTGFQNLVACVELDPAEAAVMDQGNHGSHHQSKQNKLQVRAQLANRGVREDADGTVVSLPGAQESEQQRRAAFARKTYRFYDGGPVSRADLLDLLADRPVAAFSRGLDELTFAELGAMLRWFGQFHSDERLLPKYAYASPGALYATQMYLETSGIAGLDAGSYYYHPVKHALVRIGAARPGAELSVHFVGRSSAIEPVYTTNVREVLEFETGHMLGVFEEILSERGLMIRPSPFDESIMEDLGVAAEDHYLGTFAIGPRDGSPDDDPTEIYVQAHPGQIADLPAGQYRHRGGALERISDEMVQPKHVIAINQRVHERASFGIAAVSRARDGRLDYVNLGKKLHHLQRNGLGIGLMSSGYSSRSGHPLAAARRLDAVLESAGIEPGPSYFFLGGRVSDEQIRGEDMYEDTVHMQGPAEILKEDLARVVPDHMVPNRVLVLDQLPLTANGKVDTAALATSDEVAEAGSNAPHVEPSTDAERRLARLWSAALKYEQVSVEDEFFTAGGTSLTAVTLVNRIGEEFGVRLPLQALFEHPKLADLAARITSDSPVRSSRLVRLHDSADDRPVFCWPGLGGQPVNLRQLARESDRGGPFCGVQIRGLNAGEETAATIPEMAADDLAEIRELQPRGPYRLWGYSFGARPAFEAAWHLEQLGERVEHLFLICPGNPRIPGDDRFGRQASFDNPTYVAILFSVFAGTTTGPELQRCLDEVRDEDDFTAFVAAMQPSLSEPMIRRITRIVARTYEFEHGPRELAERRLAAPVTVFKAAGDDRSSLEDHPGLSGEAPDIVHLDADHYGALREPGVAELASAIRART